MKGLRLISLLLFVPIALSVASCSAETGDTSVSSAYADTVTAAQAPADSETAAESAALSSEAAGSSYASEETTAAPAAFSDVINSENSYSFTVKKLFTVPMADPYKYVQGGCTDGTYYYTSVITYVEADQSQNRSTVYKYDMSTWELVAQKADLPLCHCNDMCYNPDTGRLYVANNSPENKKITVLNPETLEIEKHIYIADAIYSITYNSSRQRYVVGISGCENFAVYDSNFKRIKQFNGTVTGYTKQGIESDDSYIYVLYYNQNCIMVYNWSGKFVSRMDLPGHVNNEPEHLCIVGDRILIGTNGARFVFRLTVKKKTE